MRYLFSFLILCVKISFSQTTEFNYLGTLILSDHQSISFSIHFNEQNGVVNGYSLTNIGNPDETRSDLNGIYLKRHKSFQLQETQILSTSSEADLSTFCFIKTNLSFNKKITNKTLEGEFFGLFTNNDTCAEGKIILIRQENIDKKVKKIKNQFKNLEEESDLLLVSKQLKDGDDFVIKWEADELQLFVWDANREDGDKIRLKINNEIILYNYTTKSKRKEVKYNLKEGENIIEITALNSGSTPPNTSSIELVDSNIKYPIISQLELGKSVIITIMK